LKSLEFYPQNNLNLEKKQNLINVKEELFRLKLQLNYYENLLKKARRYAEFEKVDFGYKLKLATIKRVTFGRCPYSYLIIDKGRKDGIRENQAVCTLGKFPEYELILVGKVKRVWNKEAVILPFINPKIMVAARLYPSGYRAITQAINNKLIKLNFVPSEAKISLGDRVETSGEGGIYPEGLLLGWVNKLTQTNSLFLEVYFYPALELAQLKEVAIILKEE
jgi:rod shape-determining protein MreC